MQRIITPEEYDALIWIKQYYEPHKKVLANPFLSIAVYPVTSHRVIGLMPSTLEGGSYARANDFFRGGCEFKEDVARSEKVDLVISDQEISCGFLGKVYSKDGVIVYKVK